jgi:branched-chain amino acid transport system ATP-binding protein
MLEISKLESGYGRIPILHGVDFKIAQGECVGLWGHNGMGKTTLLKTIMGYLKANSGSIEFAGQDITKLPCHLRARFGLGLVPQGRQIFPTLTVTENLAMGSAAMPNDAGNIQEEVLEMFPRLKPLLSRTGGLLSGGEQQLLALARCLCGRPKMIMLDEPTEGIQPSINDEIAETLIYLREKQNLTMIVVEQKREFLASLTNRVLIMQRGAIAKEITAAELITYDEFH